MNSRNKLILLISYALCILILSSIPGDGFSKLSILWTSDKLAHFLEYSVFGFLLHFSGLFQNDLRRRVLYIAFLYLAFPLFDEIYQSIIPGRTTDHLDLLADYAGELTGITISILIQLPAVIRIRRHTGPVK